MAIGNWGSVIRFEVTSRKVLTFHNFKRTVGGRWKSHPIVGKKPKGEFVGPDTSGISMEATLSADRGINPRGMLKQMEAASERGQVEYLYIGGKKVGSGKLALESISETWDEIWNNGELVKASTSLTFSEYS